ncbi:unnamed protein product [Arctogadus glacialis]
MHSLRSSTRSPEQLCRSTLDRQIVTGVNRARGRGERRGSEPGGAQAESSAALISDHVIRGPCDHDLNQCLKQDLKQKDLKQVSLLPGRARP